MRKLFVLVGVAMTALMVLSSPAAAKTTCNSSTPMTGATITGDLVVPEDGECTIAASTVGDDVKVGKNAFFQASGSTIGDDVKGNGSQTILIDKQSTVGGDIKASKTAQVFIFDSTVNGNIGVRWSTDQVNLCGNTVDGRIEVKDSGRDILIGDPKTVGCAGNTVLNHHRIRVEDNNVDVELIVAGNTVQGGDLEVNDNHGTASKEVRDNKGGDGLECRGNEQPFTASGNTGWNSIEGQCAVPPTECSNSETPQTLTVDGDLVVPEDSVCKIVGSTVAGTVKVGKNAYFQASGSTIGGDVKGRQSTTVFIDANSTVGGEVDTSSTFQVFLFDSSVGDEIDVKGTSGNVNICGNKVQRDIEVSSSGRDILVGDPLTQNCAGNTVGDDIRIDHNNVDVELVVRGNSVTDDLLVRDNEGTAGKFVDTNTGGDRLVCEGNEDPFTGSPNAGFASSVGQCSSV